MKKIFLIWAVLVLAAPAMAEPNVVDVCAVPIVGSDLVEIRYRVVSGQLPRAFALDITVTDGNIADVTGFFRGGECDDVNKGYGIFPANFRRYINADFNNWADVNYTPVAHPCDLPGDTQGGIDTNGITIEMGSLYEDDNSPPTEGLLCVIQVTEDCTINIAANVGRGKMVLEDGTSKDPDSFHSGQGLLHDWGDADDPTYPTLKSSTPKGARHIITKMPGLHLGTSVDPDPDGQPTPGADGDDNDGFDDEDGVVFGWVNLTGGTVTVTAAMSGLLDAWIDFNGNGVWEHPGEQISANTVLAAGPNPLLFCVPGSAVPGTTVARFRFSALTEGNLKPWHEGVRPNGEVEDHTVVIEDVEDCMACTNPDYANWVTFGKPDCWCYAKQCRGDVDGLIEYNTYWVFANDLNLFKISYGRTVAQLPTNGICCDLDHAIEYGTYWVFANDLNIFKTKYGRTGLIDCGSPPDSNFNFWLPLP